MNCSCCTRRHFLKLSAAAAGMMGFPQILSAGNPAGKLPALTISVTSRCIFPFVVIGHEDQKTFPNPYKNETACRFTMNSDCSGVNKGVAAVLAGKADIGTLHRPLTAEEQAAGIRETRLDSLAYSVIVHKNNPVNELGTEQVLKIFAGRIRNWKEVGGKDRDILIYRQECGANYDDLIGQALQKAGIAKDPERLKQAVMSVEITDNQFEKIADLEMAVTMAPRFFWDENSKALKISGILPSREAEKNGDYPFLANISLVTPSGALESAQKYLAFMKSPHGKELIEKGLAMDWLRQGF